MTWTCFHEIHSNLYQQITKMLVSKNSIIPLLIASGDFQIACESVLYVFHMLLLSSTPVIFNTKLLKTQKYIYVYSAHKLFQNNLKPTEAFLSCSNIWRGLRDNPKMEKHYCQWIGEGDFWCGGCFCLSCGLFLL